MDGSLTAIERAQGLIARGLLGLPRPLLRVLAGRPIERDGQRLDPEAALFLRLNALAGGGDYATLTPVQMRRQIERDSLAVQGRLPELAAIGELTVEGIPARLYDPRGGPPGGLLVYYHGGGFVTGGLNTHEHTCRLLALAAGLRVLAVDYRLAPEHRFPAAAQDAWSAYAWAAAHAEQLGADPARLAVGGDSAGGNLAAGVAQRAARESGPAPRAQVLFYPWLDLSRKRRSYELFGSGFYLETADLDADVELYVREAADVTDPRCSPLLADELAGVAPAYIATAGFDPLRDEGEEYAQRLRAAGVRAALVRHSGLFHGFASMVGTGRTGREAVLAAAGALALALA